MSSSLITYTSTLPKNLVVWLDSTAKKQKTSKKNIIVEALSQYRQHLIKQEMASGFRKAAQDKEILAMAEEGMDDYLENL